MTRSTLLAAAAALALALPAPVRAADRDAAKQHADQQGGGWNQDAYGEPFLPSPGVVCLPKPRQCYEDGRLSWRWSNRIFG